MYDRQLAVLLTQEQYDWLEVEGAKRRWPKGEVVREAIDTAMATQARKARKEVAAE